MRFLVRYAFKPRSKKWAQYEWDAIPVKARNKREARKEVERIYIESGTLVVCDVEKLFHVA